MGVETRRIPLPAPTDSPTEETHLASGTDIDLATDISRQTDKTSYTIPEDGREITIPSKSRRDRSSSHQSPSSNKHPSQTSLLIEYFEGGKGPNVSTRPSVRVKVTPSAARKNKDSNEHVLVSEKKAGRKASYTRRISLGPPSTGERQLNESASATSVSSYTSAAEESSLAHRHPPVEIEVMGHDQRSLRSRESQDDARLIHVNPSDLSSMPPDSMLEEKHNATLHRTRSRSTSREVLSSGNNMLKAPQRTRSRSLSKERIAHKAMEKLTAKSREGGNTKQRRSSKSSRSRSVSNEHLDTLRSPRRRSGKHQRDDEVPSTAESSVLSTSNASSRRLSNDQYSVRSGASKSSINANPKLLETVENAIRRMIMPELETLKQQQRMQKSRQKFETDSLASGSTLSRAEPTRRLSKHSSAPDVARRPDVVLNRNENDPGTILSHDSMKGRKEHRKSRHSDSPRERRSERELSEETVIQDGKSATRRKSKDGHRLRNAAAGGLAGAVLTTAALSHHDMKHSDSQENVDRERRRRRRSKSHSRSASVADSLEDPFQKHGVPPMPLQSDIHSSDITRDSILSDETSGTRSPPFEIQKATVRSMARGLPREVSSGSRTPTKAQTNLQRTLNTNHGNLSEDDLAQQSPRKAQFSPRRNEHDSRNRKSSAFGADVIAANRGDSQPLTSDRLAERDYHDYDFEHQNRGLSPIQSVSSRQESELNREPYHRQHSLPSIHEQFRRKSAASSRSETSIASAAFDHTNRPQGIHLEPGEEVLDQHGRRLTMEDDRDELDQDPAIDEWLENEHRKNEQYRSSVGKDSLDDPTVEYRHMTNFTDDSMDGNYLDQKPEGQQHKNVTARKSLDYRTTPVAVESAVASLLDTSVVSTRDKIGERSFIDSPDHDDPRDSAYSASREVHSKNHLHDTYPNEGGLRDPYGYSNHSNQSSPHHSIAQSVDESVKLGATGIPVADDPIPEIGHGMHSGSDISTNPSIIQGPMAGTPLGSRDHWPTQPTPPQSKREISQPRRQESAAQESLKTTAAGFLATAAASNVQKASVEDNLRSQDWSDRGDEEDRSAVDELQEQERDIGNARDSYMTEPGIASPPRDEGYASGPQRGIQSPGLAFKNAASFNDGDVDLDDDPFTGAGHTRHLSTNSGLARGMGSPLYDSATGNGIDRIQSKDIVALMDHLTVRDAQRNARDTEILVTLVRSAAEMRNSFEEMKKFIAQQDDILVEAGNKQHDRTVQKIGIGGPRPQPARYPPRAGTDEGDEDTSTKRRNVFRRALKGLSGRNQNDISKIEEMLEHLLGEVESLKPSRDPRPTTADVRAQGLDSYHNLRASAPAEYGASGAFRSFQSPVTQAGMTINSPTRGPSAVRALDRRQSSQNRVSTVLEADEELDEHEQAVLDKQFEHDDDLLTPTRERPRPGSVPLGTPPHIQLAAGPKSNENTPKTSMDNKSRKHKSSSSSIFPKVSRWSRTTASSFGDNIRNSVRKERPMSEASRSGELQQFGTTGGHYDHTGDDRLRSNTSLQRELDANLGEHFGDEDLEEYSDGEGARPPSPLIPSHISDDPKYQAHRNSLNLQHPQPRAGPTHRYQTHLESQAQTYSTSPLRGSPALSPTSDTFGSEPALSRYMPPSGHRYSTGAGNLSPISDGGYSNASASEQSAAPPRPPKLKDDGPLIPNASSSSNTAGPSRPPKLATRDNRPTFASPLSKEHLKPDREDDRRYSNESATNEATNPTSRRYSTMVSPTRKPTGPRPITSSGSYSSPNADGARPASYRRNQAVDASADDDDEDGIF